MRSQPSPHACGYSLCYLWLQPPFAIATASICYGCSLHLLRLQVRTQSLECRPGQEALSWGRVELALRLPRRAIAAPGAALQLSIVEEASGMVRSALTNEL